VTIKSDLNSGQPSYIYSYEFIFTSPNMILGFSKKNRNLGYDTITYLLRKFTGSSTASLLNEYRKTSERSVEDLAKYLAKPISQFSFHI